MVQEGGEMVLGRGRDWEKALKMGLGGETMLERMVQWEDGQMGGRMHRAIRIKVGVIAGSPRWDLKFVLHHLLQMFVTLWGA